MIACTFEELVEDLRLRRQQTRLAGERPPALLLGAGASVESGIGAMTDLFKLVNRDTFAEFCEYIRPRTEDERYRLLARFLQTQQPAAVTPGYRALAALCEEAYFDLLLTTNLDPLLDDALAAARLWRRDYILLVNGVVRPERMDQLLRAPTPRVKVVKLHGDLFHRFMAWTPAEMEQWVDDIRPHLATSLHGRDVLVVGHSLRDARVREMVLGTGGALWYATPFTVPDVLAGNDLVRAVTGDRAAFETLFTGLAAGLGVELGPAAAAPPPPAAAAPARRRAARGLPGVTPAPAGEPAARTVDDLLAATVAIVGPGGQRMMTGFLLASPRVIVTDGYAGNVAGDVARLTVETADERRFDAPVLHRERGHPFGPIVLTAPEALRVPGLRLDPAPGPAGTRVRIAVAAGARTGVSAGQVTSGRTRSIDIAPIGRVTDMVELGAVVAPGASGAPVVDADLAVRGFIVAGRDDHPPSFMYPASAWAAGLARTVGPAPGARGSAGPDG